VVVVPAADADPESESAAGHPVEGGDLLGKQRRRAQRAEQHLRLQPNSFGGTRQHRQRRLVVDKSEHCRSRMTDHGDGTATTSPPVPVPPARVPSPAVADAAAIARASPPPMDTALPFSTLTGRSTLKGFSVM